MLATTTRSATARRFEGIRRAGERGAAPIEYVGLLLIVAVALVVAPSMGRLAGNSGSLVQPINYGLCKALEKAYKSIGVDVSADCKKVTSTTPRKLPPCVTYQQDRLLSVNGSFRFIRGELTGKDTIVDTVDPVTGKDTSYVFLSNEAGVGLEAKDGGKGNLASKLDNAGVGFNAKAMIDGGTGVVYKFDSHDDAQHFLDERRGNIFTRALGVITGGKADALYDGARKAVKWLGGLVGIGDGEDHGPTPSGVTANLAVQADAGVSFEKGPKKSPIDFRADANVSGKAEGTFRYNFDGTSQLDVRYEGGFKLNGGAGVNKDIQKKLPLLGDLSATGGVNGEGAVAYRIVFDKHGTPTNFVLTTESQHGWQYKVGAKATNKSGKNNELTVNTYNLDLTDPANMDAFKQTLPALAGGGPVSPMAILLTDNPLGQRLRNNSVQYKQVYDVDGDAYAADAPKDSTEKGIKIKGVGIGYNNDTSRRTLKYAQYIDHREPGATWQPLAKCGGKK